MNRVAPRIAGALLLLVLAGWLGFVAVAGQLAGGRALTARDRARVEAYAEQVTRAYADRVVARRQAEPSDADLDAVRYAGTAILRTGHRIRRDGELSVLLRVEVGLVRTCFAVNFHDLGGPRGRYDVARLGSCG